jgi:hypothetical protein
MSSDVMASRIAKVLGEHPDLALELYCTASEVADDFGDYGPVLQADEAGIYSNSTAIIRLTQARDRVIKKLRAE